MLLSVFGFVGFIGLLIKKVLAGEGHEYYFTGFGYQFSYLGALILIGLTPVIIGGVFIIQWWSEKDERDFKRRYIKNDSEHE